LTELRFRGKTAVEAEKEMHDPTTKIDDPDELDSMQLPGSLMESFDAYREDSFRSATAEFTPSQLDWYLDLLNRFREPEDRQDSLLGVLDPAMCTVDHPAWDAPPGTRIEMPALNSNLAKLADRNSLFAEFARDEIQHFRDLAESFANEELLGLASIARAALVDRAATFEGRQDAIHYLALNASALLEGLWGVDNGMWPKAPPRQIEFEDMLAKKQAELRRREATRPAFEEEDFVCYSEDEVRAFAIDIRTLLLRGRAKHLAICPRCRSRVKYWSGVFEGLERVTPSRDGRPDA